MSSDRIVYKDYVTLENIPTSHLVGLKKVLLSNTETLSNITQISIATIKANQIVEIHVHPSMDEHFIVLSGEGTMGIDNQRFELYKGIFVLVPAGSFHDLKASSDLKFLSIGVSL